MYGLRSQIYAAASHQAMFVGPCPCWALGCQSLSSLVLLSSLLCLLLSCCSFVRLNLGAGVDPLEAANAGFDFGSAAVPRAVGMDFEFLLGPQELGKPQ